MRFWTRLISKGCLVKLFLFIALSLLYKYSVTRWCHKRKLGLDFWGESQTLSMPINKFINDKKFSSRRFGSLYPEFRISRVHYKQRLLYYGAGHLKPEIKYTTFKTLRLL